MCSNPPEETLEHMLFHCSFSQSCWQVLGLTWQAFGDRLHILEEGIPRWQTPLFMDIVLLACWNIWKERNTMLFDEGIDPMVTSWKARLKVDL
jgi:hypothetical protein